MIYKCIRSFKAKDGKSYYYGEKISESRYNLLTVGEARNFQKIEEQIPQKKNDAVALDMPTEIFSGIVPDSIIDMAIDSVNSHDDFIDSTPNVDYGGGDSGGGGATGDW